VLKTDITPSKKNKKNNHLDGGSVVKTWDQSVAPSVISDLSPVVAHMMAIGDLHSR
jgi:hypothetical protein